MFVLYLDRKHVAPLGDPVPDLAAVQGVIIAEALGGLVLVVGVLPGLREGSIVPDVAVVRKAVGDESQLALLLVLDDGVERGLSVNLHLGVCPPDQIITR